MKRVEPLYRDSPGFENLPECPEGVFKVAITHLPAFSSTEKDGVPPFEVQPFKPGLRFLKTEYTVARLDVNDILRPETSGENFPRQRIFQFGLDRAL